MLFTPLIQVNTSRTSQTALVSQLTATTTTQKPAVRAGVSYVRWGKKTCPDDNELIMSGKLADQSAIVTL